MRLVGIFTDTEVLPSMDWICHHLAVGFSSFKIRRSLITEHFEGLETLLKLRLVQWYEDPPESHSQAPFDLELMGLARHDIGVVMKRNEFLHFDPRSSVNDLCSAILKENVISRTYLFPTPEGCEVEVCLTSLEKYVYRLVEANLEDKIDRFLFSSSDLQEVSHKDLMSTQYKLLVNRYVNLFDPSPLKIFDGRILKYHAETVAFRQFLDNCG